MLENTSNPFNSNFNEISAASTTYYFHGYAVVVPLALVILFIIVLAVGGNVVVILTIIRHKAMGNRTKMLIGNLAVADILVALLDMPLSLVTIVKGDWIFGDTLCQLNAFTVSLFLNCSIHTLMYISVHKCISISKPFSRFMTSNKVKIMIAASWSWAAVCALGPVIGWNGNVYMKGSSQCGPDIPITPGALSHSFLITISNYIMPLMVMLICYFKIFREVYNHIQRIRVTSNIDHNTLIAQQKKVVTTLFLVLACFLLCWTPFVVYSNALLFFRDKSSMPLIMNPLAYWCGYLNSACNPIIYSLRSSSFRRYYRDILLCVRPLRIVQPTSSSYSTMISTCNNVTLPVFIKSIVLSGTLDSRTSSDLDISVSNSGNFRVVEKKLPNTASCKNAPSETLDSWSLSDSETSTSNSGNITVVEQKLVNTALSKSVEPQKSPDVQHRQPILLRQNSWGSLTSLPDLELLSPAKKSTQKSGAQFSVKRILLRVFRSQQHDRRTDDYSPRTADNVSLDYATDHDDALSRRENNVNYAQI